MSDEAIDALLMCSESQLENGQIFHAGQSLETAAGLRVSQRRGESPEEATELYVKSAEMFELHGDVDKAASMLLKAAKLAEGFDVDAAKALYLRAPAMFDDSERAYMAPDKYRPVLRFIVTQGDLAGALELEEKMIALFQGLGQLAQVYKCYLEQIIVLLALGDTVRADKQFELHLREAGYLRSKECKTAEDLLDAYKNFDDEALSAVKKAPSLRYIEGSIARVCKGLSIGGSAGSTGGGAGSSGRASAASRRSAAAASADDDAPTDEGDEVDAAARAALFAPSKKARAAPAAAADDGGAEEASAVVDEAVGGGGSAEAGDGSGSADGAAAAGEEGGADAVASPRSAAERGAALDDLDAELAAAEAEARAHLEALATMTSATEDEEDDLPDIC
eukprot:PLAT12704.2.p2 GENE.PLAT12704.2~~PLAT12704.2.p2  ORF type:complete len:393 (+),score=189.13 PLAT12704.2:268-1446(+)